MRNYRKKANFLFAVVSLQDIEQRKKQKKLLILCHLCSIFFAVK